MKKIFIFLILIWLPQLSRAQCAMCRAVLETEASQTAAEGINQGIMYLMVFPYLLMAGVGYMIYRSRKKDRKKAAE